jgi:cobalt-zinc-cadmium efflux system protein
METMQAHDHSAGHDPHHGHIHPAPRGKFLGIALAATLGLVIAELAGGRLGHSVALVSDAFHNLSDIPTIAISWLAARWSERPADAQKTFGYRRAGILAAFTNGILLALVALGLFWEAFQRFLHPVAVQEQWMVGLSLLALAINGGITLGLWRSRGDLNLRALVVHNLGDAASNVGILIAALVIHWKGILWLDPVAGAMIGALVLWSTMGILRESGHILLEGLPREMELASVAHRILNVQGVQEVHDVHIWTLGADEHALSCHVRIPDMHMAESEKLLASIRECLAQGFGIHHTTIQFERAGLPPVTYYMPSQLRATKH